MSEVAKSGPRSALMHALSAEKVPYVVTLVVAALGFLVSQTLSRYDKLPIVEYSWKKGPALGDVEAYRAGASGAGSSGAKVFPTTLPDSPEWGYVVTLQNISAATVIRCAAFHVLKLPVHFAPPPKISNWMVSSATSSIVKTSNSGDVNLVAIKVFDMQPGADVQIRLNGASIQELALVASPCAEGDVPKGTPTGDVPIVKQTSFETVFIKHALTTFWFGLVAWVVLLLVAISSRLRGGVSSEA